LPGRFGITFSHVHRALLMARENVAQFVPHTRQLVVNVQHCTAGITKDGVHTFAHQRVQ
jgi:hypothetical protein